MNVMRPNSFVTHGKTKLVQGSVLMPELGNLRLIFVPCSETGKPDGEIYKLLDKKWRNARAEFKGWYSNHMNFKLGFTQTTCVQSDVWLIQSLCINKLGKVDDKALLTCVKKISEMAKIDKASIHISTIVTDEMPQIMDMLNTECIEKGISVYFYQEQNVK